MRPSSIKSRDRHKAESENVFRFLDQRAQRIGLDRAVGGLESRLGDMTPPGGQIVQQNAPAFPTQATSAVFEATDRVNRRVDAAPKN